MEQQFIIDSLILVQSSLGNVNENKLKTFINWPLSETEKAPNIRKGLLELQQSVTVDEFGTLHCHGVPVYQYNEKFRRGDFRIFFNGLNIKVEIPEEEVMKKEFKTLLLDIKLTHNFQKKKEQLLENIPELAFINRPANVAEFSAEQIPVIRKINSLILAQNPSLKGKGYISYVENIENESDIIKASKARHGYCVVGKNKFLKSQNLEPIITPNNKLIGFDKEQGKSNLLPSTIGNKILINPKLYLLKHPKENVYDPSALSNGSTYQEIMKKIEENNIPMFENWDNSFVSIPFNQDDKFSEGYINREQLHPLYSIIKTENNILDLMLDILFFNSNTQNIDEFIHWWYEKNTNNLKPSEESDKTKITMIAGPTGFYPKPLIPIYPGQRPSGASPGINSRGQEFNFNDSGEHVNPHMAPNSRPGIPHNGEGIPYGLYPSDNRYMSNFRSNNENFYNYPPTGFGEGYRPNYDPNRNFYPDGYQNSFGRWGPNPTHPNATHSNVNLRPDVQPFSQPSEFVHLGQPGSQPTDNNLQPSIARIPPKNNSNLSGGSENIESSSGMRNVKKNSPSGRAEEDIEEQKNSNMWFWWIGIIGAVILLIVIIIIIALSNKTTTEANTQISNFRSPVQY